MSSQIRILSTKKLKSNQMQFLLNAGFSVIDADFISTAQTAFELANVAPNLIITSQNSAKALASHPEVQEIRRNPVFCVGEKTADLLDELGFTVQETAENGKALSEIITAEYAGESFTFFCGNIRRDEIPMALLQAGIRMNEIRVYETNLAPVEINAEIDGILFFSPSAVESFLSKNQLTAQACFCIGQTTADYLVSATNLDPKNIVVANSATVESTIAKCVNYFTNLQGFQNLVGLKPIPEP